MYMYIHVCVSKGMYMYIHVFIVGMQLFEGTWMYMYMSLATCVYVCLSGIWLGGLFYFLFFLVSLS